MNDSHANDLRRSSELLGRETSALVVIDVQEKLMPVIVDTRRLIWNIGRLIEAAQRLNVPVFVTEQYPSGLGTTVEPLRSQLPTAVEKTRFSCGQCAQIIDSLSDDGRCQVVLAGIESHVCVTQSALDLAALGFRVFVVEDAVSSRSAATHQAAMRRLEAEGVTLLPTESAIFEWCEDAADSQFKAISQLVRQEPP
jgi:nicotinamidase-related amidase